MLCAVVPNYVNLLWVMEVLGKQNAQLYHIRNVQILQQAIF